MVRALCEFGSLFVHLGPSFPDKSLPPGSPCWARSTDPGHCFVCACVFVHVAILVCICPQQLCWGAEGPRGDSFRLELIEFSLWKSVCAGL